MEYTKIPNIFVREQFGNNKLIEGEYATEELKTLANIPWVWTEKVDGTNIRVCWDGYRVTFAGRTDKAQIPKEVLSVLESLFGGESKEELFEQTFGTKPCILFGEGYGKKIQKNGELYGEPNFIMFDAYVGNTWLLRSDVETIAEKFGVKCVPIVNVVTLPEAVEFVRSHPKSNLRDYEMEGIVCRPIVELLSRRGNRIIVKIKCRDFEKDGLG